MPVQSCRSEKLPGFRWGEQGKCYTYTPNNVNERNRAKQLAYKQGNAIGDYELETYSDYPQSASDNACRALKWVDKNGWGDCGEATGKERANQLCKRENISRETISRMASFQRHQQHKDVPYDEGCGGLMWDAWGGTEGIEWAQRKLKQIKDLEKIERIKYHLLKNRVSFDYDGVLTQRKMIDKVKTLIQGGMEVFIISARSNDGELKNLASKIGIPFSRVYATGSNKEKINTIRRLGIEKHFDDNRNVIRELGSKGVWVN